MAGRIIICGDLAARYEAQRVLVEAHPDLHVETVEHPWELVQKAESEGYDVAFLLKGAIAQHQERLHAVQLLRSHGFPGRVLYAGAFLTEKQDALLAGADYAFDPDQQRVEQVAAAALYRPVLAADHAYLRALLVGEWVDVLPYLEALPSQAVDVLLCATSCHADSAFWTALVGYCKGNPKTRCIVVEDDGKDEARVEALATGIQPYVDLAQEGLSELARLVRQSLREAWLACVAKA